MKVSIRILQYDKTIKKEEEERKISGGGEKKKSQNTDNSFFVFCFGLNTLCCDNEYVFSDWRKAAIYEYDIQVGSDSTVTVKRSRVS